MHKLLALGFFPAFHIFAAGPAFFGVRGGIPFSVSDSIAGGLGGSSAVRYAVGPTAGFRLPHGLSVEGDALYKRQPFNLNVGSFGEINVPGTTVSAWEFPIMLKFTSGEGPVVPVLGGGITFRRMSAEGLSSMLYNVTGTRSAVGAIAGAGVRFRVGPIDVTPEFRLARWNQSGFETSFVNIIPFSRTEATFLVGVTF